MTITFRRLLNLTAVLLVGTCAIAAAQTEGPKKPEAPTPTLLYGMRRLPDQLTGSFLRTNSAYALRTPEGLVENKLNGVNIQFAYRRFFPLEIVSSYRFSTGSLLGQQLHTYTAGVGYLRPWRRFTPVLQASAGVARTSSSGDMYLYAKPRYGFTTSLTAGMDVTVNRKWGVRPFYVENAYLPYGEIQSLYWSFGSGIYYRFSPRRLSR